LALKRKLISGGMAYEGLVGYSRAVVCGDWVFVSGTTGRNRLTGEIPEDTVTQIHNTFETIAWALAEAGSSMAEVVRGRIVISDPSEEPLLVPVIAQYLKPVRPALTMYVAELLDHRLKIEIDVTALRGSAGS
jgi:enamine deaminase RidA (YjgF/YER057c/UK114 family)